MIQIRSKVFETNSSSMHSIALMNDKNDKIKTFEEANAENPMRVTDGVLCIPDDEDLEFGWGFEIINTFYGRLCYAIASYGDNDMDFIIETVHDLFPEIDDIQLPTASYGSGGLTTGYVDHQSMGTLHSFLNKNNMSLADYLIDKRVMVIIDNDNSCHFSEIVLSGIFNKNITLNAGSDYGDDYEDDYEDEEEGMENE